MINIKNLKIGDILVHNVEQLNQWYMKPFIERVKDNKYIVCFVTENFVIIKNIETNEYGYIESKDYEGNFVLREEELYIC